MFNDPRRGKQAVRDLREKKGSLKKDASFDARRQAPTPLGPPPHGSSRRFPSLPCSDGSRHEALA